MSGSPRKLLRRALDALRQVEEIAERYPAARAELATTLGPARMNDLLRARQSVEAALEALEHARSTPAAGSADGPAVEEHSPDDAEAAHRTR